MKSWGSSSGPLAALLASLTGCGAGTPHTPNPRALEVALQPAEAIDVSVRAPFTVVEIPVAKGADERWSTESSRAFDSTGLTLRGPGPRVAKVRGPFDPAHFDRVVLDLDSSAPDDVRIAFTRAGVPAELPEPVALAGGAQRVTVELEWSSREPLDELWIVFTAAVAPRSTSSRIAAVRLEDAPPAYFLPIGADGPRWVEVARDWRPAHGLLSGTPLVGEFDASAGGVLRTSIGVPRGADTRVRGGRIEIVVERGGERVTRELRLPSEDADWIDVEIPLSGLGPGRGSVRATLSGDAAQACALAAPRITWPEPDPPTLVLVTSDTHRADHLGAARSGVEIDTPFLDALAARGLLFENCASTTNVTNPSHAAILTATHPRDTGVVDNRTRLAADAPTLAEAFSDAGWTTFAATSASHLSTRRSGLGQGFERFASPAGGETGDFDAIAKLEGWLAAAEGRPLFVWLHLFDAHAPYGPPPDFVERYWPETDDPLDPSVDRPGVYLPSWAKNVRDLSYLDALYRGEVSYLDARLAGFFEHARLRDALIAFTSDHGEHLGQHGVWCDHRLLYPGSLRVPMILAGTGVPAGQRVPHRVQNVDLARTLLDLAGLRETRFPGRDLVRLAAEPVRDEPRFALASGRASASIEAGRWFLVLHLRAHDSRPGEPTFERHEVELYDLETDPACTSDLSADEREQTIRLRERLVEWLLAAHPADWGDAQTDLSANERAELAELGYAEGTEDGPPPESNAAIDPSCDCAHCADLR